MSGASRWKVELVLSLKFQRCGSAVSEMPADNKQSRNTPAFGQACVLLFSTVLPFPVASQTQSTYSRRWTDAILFKFFLLYSKPNIYLIFILPLLGPIRRWNQGMSDQEEENESWGSPDPSIHLIQQHVFATCHFSSALLGTGYINFLPTAFRMRRT